MLNIIKSDLFRLFRSKGIYIIFFVLLLMAVLSAIAKEPGNIGTVNISAIEEMDDISNSKESEDENIAAALGHLNEQKTDEEKHILSLEFIGTNMNLYYLILFVVSIVLTADFSNKTIKNTLSSITSKRTYFFGKLILIASITLILLFANTLVFYIVNLIINSEVYHCSLRRMLKATILQIPIMLGLTSLLMLIAFFFKNSAIYNGISIAGIATLQFILLIIFATKKVHFLDTFIKKYELQQALYQLAVAPETFHTVVCTVIGTAFTIISLVLSYRVFQHSEIK
ncbi:MAG: ABC transporter permease subunit [Ruminococcus sp.]|nr:ABC transporter permease subunit [Ruminococcus sp.]